MIICHTLYSSLSVTSTIGIYTTTKIRMKGNEPSLALGSSQVDIVRTLWTTGIDFHDKPGYEYDTGQNRRKLAIHLGYKLGYWEFGPKWAEKRIIILNPLTERL